MCSTFPFLDTGDDLMQLDKPSLIFVHHALPRIVFSSSIVVDLHRLGASFPNWSSSSPRCERSGPFILICAQSSVCHSDALQSVRHSSVSHPFQAPNLLISCKAGGITTRDVSASGTLGQSVVSVSTQPAAI